MFLHKSICKLCGKEKEYRYKSKIRDYCGYKCSNQANWQTKPKADRIKFICKTCKNEFEMPVSVKNSREKQGDNIQYCSAECMGIGMRKRHSVNCLNCGLEFETTRKKRKYCSVACTISHKTKTGSLKKTGYWMENGYKVLYTENGKGIKEHIKVMQDHIGREINDGEVVHHINEIRTDNRIENLQLMTNAEHSSYHRKKEKKNGMHLFGGHNNN